MSESKSGKNKTITILDDFSLPHFPSHSNNHTLVKFSNPTTDIEVHLVFPEGKNPTCVPF